MQIVTQSTAKYSTTDHKHFTGVLCNADTLDSGVYRGYIDSYGGIHFDKIDHGKSTMLEFPSLQQREVIEEIKEFWQKQVEYQTLGVTHKRGVLLYGEPGGGKTSVINILIKDIVEVRKGIVFDFRSPLVDIKSIQFFRKAEPTRPLLIIMEDIDALFGRDGDNHESAILNLLDGVMQIDNVVFLATSNYPEKLAARITDRPSRFDKVVHVGSPAKEDREFYIKHLISSLPTEKKRDIDLKQWVKDTDSLSVAHIKELVISVMLYGKEYQDTLHNLDKMKHPLTVNGRKGTTGFK